MMMLRFVFIILCLLFVVHLAKILTGGTHLVEVRAHDKKSHEKLLELSSDEVEGEKIIHRSETLGVFIARLDDAIDLKEKEGLHIHWDDGVEEDYRKRSDRGIKGVFSGYTTHSELLETIRNAATDHPDKARSLYIGRSVNGREILGLRMSRCPETGCIDKPSVAYMGPVHGDEVVGREMLVKLIKWIIDNDPENAEAEMLLDYVDLYIIPTLNPDGYEAKSRENAHGVDLNRAFPDRCGVDKRSEGEWTDGSDEPEITAIKNWLLRYQPTGTLWFHGGAEVISYPYNARCNGGFPRHGASLMPEDDLLKEFAYNYAQHNPSMIEGVHGPNGTTNGADWYFLYGGHEDYTMNAIPRTVFAATAEISREKFPKHEEVNRLYWPNNLGSLLRFPLSFVQGIHGRVVDADTNVPILDAKIYIKKYISTKDRIVAPPLQNGKMVTSTTGGWYHRPLAIGQWEVIVVVKNYIGGRQLVTINPYKQITHDFRLRKAPRGEEHIPKNINRDFLFE